MSSLAAKIRKKKMITTSPGMGQSGTPKARIILKLNPATGLMQEYHVTKGWRPH